MPSLKNCEILYSEGHMTGADCHLAREVPLEHPLFEEDYSVEGQKLHLFQYDGFNDTYRILHTIDYTFSLMFDTHKELYEYMVEQLWSKLDYEQTLFDHLTNTSNSATLTK